MNPNRAAEIRGEYTVIPNHVDIPIDDLFENFEDIEEKFLNVSDQKLKASTIKNYLTSFETLIWYLFQKVGRI